MKNQTNLEGGGEASFRERCRQSKNENSDAKKGGQLFLRRLQVNNWFVVLIFERERWT
jgi:hypothetical protein